MVGVGNFTYNKTDLIGHGAFAVVFKGNRKEDPSAKVAVKCIAKKNLSKAPSLLTKEINILKELHHENVVKLYDCRETDSHVYLVMEYCNGGDLADYLQRKTTLSEDTIYHFLRQIVSALKVIHAKGIIHRDLKPQNLLLCHPPSISSIASSNIRIKVADFGFARFLDRDAMAVTLCGSPMYMAPEVIMSKKYDSKADLWSLGTILFQCLTSKAPFQAQNPQALKLLYERSSNLAPPIPATASPNLRDLLTRLLKKDPRQRIDHRSLFAHPFLNPRSRKSPERSSPVAVPCRTRVNSITNIRPVTMSPPSGATAHSPLSDKQWLDDSEVEVDDFVLVPAILNYADESGSGSSAGSRHSSRLVPQKPSSLGVISPVQTSPAKTRYSFDATSSGSVSPIKFDGLASPGSVVPYMTAKATSLPRTTPSTITNMLGRGSPRLTPRQRTCSEVSYAGLHHQESPPLSELRRSPSASTLLQLAFGNNPLPSIVCSSDSSSVLFTSKLSPKMLRGTVFTIGSPANSPSSTPPISFVAPPDLSEETLMDEDHNECVQQLRLTRGMVEAILEMIKSKMNPLKAINHDQDADFCVSNKHRQLELFALYSRALELLVHAMTTAQTEQQKDVLQPSNTVKSLVKRLNQLYHECLEPVKELSVVVSGVVSAEALIYQYAIDVCKSAALDELLTSPLVNCIHKYRLSQFLLASVALCVDNEKERSVIYKYQESIEARLGMLERGQHHVLTD